jgi:hypothetical protein
MTLASYHAPVKELVLTQFRYQGQRQQLLYQEQRQQRLPWHRQMRVCLVLSVLMVKALRQEGDAGIYPAPIQVVMIRVQITVFLTCLLHLMSTWCRNCWVPPQA